MKPSEEYTIHILEDEDFNMLPFGEPLEALGMTDPKKKTAWVRRTHVKDLDIGTINHEFDELMAGSSLHEINGIRYKSGKAIGRVLGPVVGPIVGIFNPVLGAAVGAAISGGTALHTQSKKPEKYGRPTFGSIGGAALGGGAGAFGGASLINAGRAAAANAGISGASGAFGTGGNVLTSGAGQTAAATSQFALPSALHGAKTALAPVQTVPQQESPFSQLAFNPFTPESAQEQVGETLQPLSLADYNKGLSNIDENLSARLSSINRTFRGQNEVGNTAFGRQAGAARSNALASREDFIRQQDEAKRVAGIF